MPRTPGARNIDYELRRRELVKTIRARLGRFGAVRASWRELATAAGLSLSSASHYFGNREAIVIAVLQEDRRTGEAALARLATALPEFEPSIREAVAQLYFGMSQGGLGEICTVGLLEGLRNEVLGPAFLQSVLEPVLAALVARLQKHQSAKTMIDCDLRVAAMQLLSPILVTHLYQVELSGRLTNPISAEEMAEQQVRGFVLAYARQTLINSGVIQPPSPG